MRGAWALLATVGGVTAAFGLFTLKQERAALWAVGYCCACVGVRGIVVKKSKGDKG